MKYSAIAAGVVLSTLGLSGTANAEDDAFITALKAENRCSICVCVMRKWTTMGPPMPRR